MCIACLFSFDNFLSNNDRLLTYVLGDRWKVMEPDKAWGMKLDEVDDSGQDLYPQRIAKGECHMFYCY